MALHRCVANAFGLALRVVVRWCSGPRGGVELGALGAGAHLWSRRQLAPLYATSSFATAHAHPRELRIPRPARELTVGPLPPVLLAGEIHRGSWTETALGALFGLPSGITVEFVLVPARRLHVPPARPAAPAIEPALVPDRLRLAPITSGERARRDRMDVGLARGRWLLFGRVWSDLPSSVVDRLVRLLAPHDGVETWGGLRFRRPGTLLRSAGPVPVGDASVAALFPLPWIRIPDIGVTAASRANGPLIGRSDGGVDCRLSWDAAEGRHLATVGETGMGKSTLLVSLARQALDRRAAVVLLDPIGDTGRELVRRLSPALAERTMWVSAAGSPKAINAIARIRGGAPGTVERRVGDLVTALRRVRHQRFPESSFWGPRIEEMVRRAIFVAGHLPRGTLVEAERLLDPDSRVPDGLLGADADAASALRAHVVRHPEDVEGARRLLSEITRNEVLRPMLCTADAEWSPELAVAANPVTIVTGDARDVGETTARYLLAVYLGLLWPEVLARRERSKVVLALDEAQWYAHGSLSEMLRLGRRFNLHTWIATQSMDALPDDVREAALTNVSDFIVFRGAPAQSRELARWAIGLSEDSILRLPRGRAIAFLGKSERVESVDVAPSPEPDRPANEGFVLGRSTDPHSGLPDEGPRADAPGSTDALGGRDGPERPGHILDILAAAAARAGGSELRVHLAHLRAAADPKGDLVRRAGVVLEGEGVLLGTTRDRRGTAWRLAAAGLARLAGPEAPPEAIARAADEILRREACAEAEKY